MSGQAYSILADALLVVHFLIAAYNVFGLPTIWLGKFTKCQFIYNPWFRYSHIARMGIVLLLVLFQQICPLTNWEFQLRHMAIELGAPHPTFTQQLVDKILYHEGSWTSFGITYGLWFLAILATLKLIPVKRDSE